jgi:hypothetical protein
VSGQVLKIATAAFLALAVGCGSKGNGTGFAPDDAGASGVDATLADGGTAAPPDLGGGDAGSSTLQCNPTSLNLAGCSCATEDATQPCYPGDPKTRNVGACKDGTQTCLKKGEFSQWSDCTGAVTPANEACSAGIDTNCNGKTGCDDPTCATTKLCDSGCTDGQMRACYTGPAGTENVGICKDGKQACQGGHWPSDCPGEVLPEPTENCCDALDHNCNGLPGCFDLFACVTNQCCQDKCKSPLDPGCVCPKGQGDTMTCPLGMHVSHSGGVIGGNDECCPCNDCKDINCCGTDVCKTDSYCKTMDCKPLPPSCNGQVSADCDDFPEDCDEPCCLCSQCP